MAVIILRVYFQLVCYFEDLVVLVDIQLAIVLDNAFGGCDWVAAITFEHDPSFISISFQTDIWDRARYHLSENATKAPHI